MSRGSTHLTATEPRYALRYQTAQTRNFLRLKSTPSGVRAYQPSFRIPRNSGQCSHVMSNAGSTGKLARRPRGRIRPVRRRYRVTLVHPSMHNTGLYKRIGKSAPEPGAASPPASSDAGVRTDAYQVIKRGRKRRRRRFRQRPPSRPRSAFRLRKTFGPPESRPNT